MIVSPARIVMRLSAEVGVLGAGFTQVDPLNRSQEFTSFQFPFWKERKSPVDCARSVGLSINPTTTARVMSREHFMAFSFLLVVGSWDHELRIFRPDLFSFNVR